MLRSETPRGDASPFDFPGDRRGVLCLHGFTGTPFSWRPVGERLAERGFTVVGPLLPGHGGTAEALDRTTWSDWYAAVDRELDALRQRCERVAVVGLSLGGLLALRLARRRGSDLAAVGAVGTPLWLPGYAGPVVQAMKRLAARAPRLAMLPKLGGADIRDPEMKRRDPSLRVFPVHALGSLLELSRIVRAEVEAVRVPAFIAHGARDHSAPPACSEELVRRLGSRDVRYLVLGRSFHVATLDVEREKLARALGDFLAERL